MNDETPLRRRIAQLEAASKTQTEAWARERAELEKRIEEAHEEALASSSDAIDLNDTTLAAVAHLNARMTAKFAEMETRAVRRMRRGRTLARRASAESRAFWFAIAVVAVVGGLVAFGKLPPAVFEATTVTLTGFVGALVVRNRSTTRREDEEEDARESEAPPPPDDSLMPPPRRRRR